MISKDQKNAFKKILGSHYTKKVQLVLEEERITDSTGKTHSRRMITQVFNGETSHILIEAAIIKCVEVLKKEKAKQETKKKKLIKSV